jgi:thiosulfate dehydrogenase [quinone] large subunit
VIITVATVLGFILGLGISTTNAPNWLAGLVVAVISAVGVGVIVGGPLGIAALFGATLNVAFLLSGSASTNPILLLAAILLVLAWKVAGWIGADRFLLPLPGTPWQHHPDVSEPATLPGAAT